MRRTFALGLEGVEQQSQLYIRGIVGLLDTTTLRGSND